MTTWVSPRAPAVARGACRASVRHASPEVHLAGGARERHREGGLRCRIALDAGGWEAVKLYVAQGLVLGLVPEIVVTREDRRRLTAIPAGHLFEPEQYGVLRAAGRRLSRAARAMLEALGARPGEEA